MTIEHTPATAVGHSSRLDSLLDAASAAEASELHLTPGRPATMRVDGRFVPLTEAPLPVAATDQLARDLCSERHWRTLSETGTVDLAYERPSARYRVSVFSQLRGYAAVVRVIPSNLRSLEEIGVPASVVELLNRPRGLVLVTGPTGSGKSTTLAAMIDYINENFERHIVTIEDPVEFRHEPKRSLITHREIGTHVPDFPSALRAVLRQDPDVIMVGELRDLETIQAALTATETGHLVLGTLHTTGAATTITRIIDAFPIDRQEQIRTQVAISLAGVVSQTLVPVWERRKQPRDSSPARPGRTAVFDVMLNTTSVANNIRNGEIVKLREAVRTGSSQGMVSMDRALREFAEQTLISWDTAVEFAQDPIEMRRDAEAAQLHPKVRR